MSYEEEFNNMMHQQEVMSPQQRHYNRLFPCHKNDNFQTSKNEEADKTYNAAKRAYIAYRVFVDLGYDVLIKTSYEDLACHFTPCEDKSGQCSFDCYGKRMCKYR